MSRLAYVKDESRLAGYLGLAGFGLELAIGYGSGGTQVFISSNEARRGIHPVATFWAQRGARFCNPVPDISTEGTTDTENVTDGGEYPVRHGYRLPPNPAEIDPVF